MGQDKGSDTLQGAVRANPLPAATSASCVLLTVVTVLSSVFANQPQIDSLLRPLYFAVLLGFFHAIGARQPQLRVLPFRLIVRGFVVLTMGMTTAAAIRGLDLDLGPMRPYLLIAFERGAVFLLGLTLVSFGIILWIPYLLDSQRVLHERYRLTRGQLDHSEQARARIEQRIVDADRLHAVGELAAGIAHDLRNPLAIIKGAASAIERGRNQRDLAKATEVIQRNIDRAERTISALLEVGSRRAPALQRTDLGRAARDVVRLVAVESQRRGVQVDIAPGPVVFALADRALLGQALLNLVLNALQASPPDTRVVIRCRSVMLGRREVAAIAVEDRGTGLVTADRSKLFTPFFTTKEDGTGLGLLSSRRIVDDMNGAIALYPRGGGGARALITLPAATEQHVEAM